MVYTMYIP
jgi:hypothetical protein